VAQLCCALPSATAAGMLTPEQIRAARAVLKWTREDLAQASGVTRQTIHRIETSDAIPPSLRTLRKIADALGCNVTALLED